MRNSEERYCGLVQGALTFATASLVTDSILAQGVQKHQIVYNRFQSVISFKPTVASVYSSEEYEKAAEEGHIKFTSTNGGS